MKPEIINFIKENKVATVCCTDGNNKPYCFQCFYAFDEENHLLFFKSSPATFHGKLLIENTEVAGTIQTEKVELLTLKGIQFTGTTLESDFPENISPSSFYHKKFPYALAKSGKVWCIKLEMVKMTDNTNIFGKKLRWERTAPVVNQ